MKKTFKVIVFLTALLAIIGCNNYFHDLIPPDENQILSFYIEGQIGSTIITNNSITVTVHTETEVHELIPQIVVSRKATVLPLSLNYIQEAFPNVNIIKTAVDLHMADDLSAFVMDLIKDNPDFTVPVIDKPIDFSGPVNFIVISGHGNIRQYRANVEIDSGLPRLINFNFSKYDNEELIKDASTNINENAKTILSDILYPMEMNYLSYALIPVFEILGDRIEIDGSEVRSGIDIVQFNQGVGLKTKTIKVWRNGQTLDYILTAIFSEDPDSIRSITDFRFNVSNNPAIAANAVASIINNDGLGTINVQVFYKGSKPSLLIPRFTTPGTVTVNGFTQTTGNNHQDFSSPVEYKVVSRNNKFIRTYTVNAQFIDIASSSPVITDFKFSSALNHELVQDTQAHISEGSGQILIEAKYSSSAAPSTLVPEFGATGLVTVTSAVQVSGFSAQNFIRQVKYTVTNPENALFTRDYWVQVSFIRDTSSDATITSFSFHPDENPSLNEELKGKIDHNAGKITVFAPIGSGVTARTMFPRFTAAGQVRVNGTVQASGVSPMSFENSVFYEAVSANGVNSKGYTVTVRELRSTIYVDCNATGEGDGSSWKDAFRHLEDACDAASHFDESDPKEIWIAKGTYKPSDTANSADYFLLTANTSYIGGFAGGEAYKNERNAASNPVVISGDLSGVYSNNLFGKFNGSDPLTVNGDITFENITFTGAKAQSGRNRGAAINAVQSAGSDLRITDCLFNDLQAAGEGGAVYAQSGNVYLNFSDFTSCSSLSGTVYFIGSGSAEIANVTFTSITNGGAVYNADNSLTITDSKIKNITGTYSIYSSGGLDADTLELHNITGQGIYITGGALNLTDIDINNVSGRSVYFNSSVNSAVFDNCFFNDCGDVYIANSSSVDAADIKITNVKSGIANGLFFNSNWNIFLENVTADNVPSGTGITVRTTGTVNIVRGNIKNTSGTGLQISNSSSTEISNTKIEFTGSEAIYNSGNNLKIINANIQNAAGSYGVYSSRGIEIDGMELHNITGVGIDVSGEDMNISNLNASNIGGRSVYFWSTAYSAVIENSSFDRCGDIYILNSSSVLISNTNIINLNNNVENALYARSAGGGNINIDNVTIENVPNGRGMQIDTSSGNVIINNASVKNTKATGPGGGMRIDTSGGNVIINDASIKNIKSTSTGGGICIYGSGSTGSADIKDTVIENVMSGYIGGGIFSNIPLNISGLIIKNIQGASMGGAIYLSGSDITSTISGLTIDNAVADDGSTENYGYGGGIYSFQNLNISGSPSVIRNVYAAANGGAILLASNANATISGLTIENATADINGGIYFISNMIIEDSHFINVTERNSNRILSQSESTIIRRCTFIYDSNYSRQEAPSSSRETGFFNNTGVFENCTFTNLRSAKTGKNFLFNRWSTYPASSGGGGSTGSNAGNLTLKNCTFNLGSGSAGIMALYGGQRSGPYMKADEILIEGCTINFSGGQTPVIWLTTSPQGSDESGTFRFKQDNKFRSPETGEITINNAAQIINLTSRGLFLFENGATPVLVP
ncbi:MAG: right-handed parallel beta-helix repeat-containing protein [Treponema sp.]|nr:right-handed parallel beta-helix repeat-containing protein [Treponema sp.]